MEPLQNLPLHGFGLEELGVPCITIGVDEVGRGALMGPVFVCAAMRLPFCPKVDGVFDSKKIPRSKRVRVFNDLLASDGHLFSLSVSTEREIEKLNVLGATLVAMRRGVDSLIQACCFGLPLSSVFQLGRSTSYLPQWVAGHIYGKVHSSSQGSGYTFKGLAGENCGHDGSEPNSSFPSSPLSSTALPSGGNLNILACQPLCFLFGSDNAFLYAREYFDSFISQSAKGGNGSIDNVIENHPPAGVEIDTSRRSIEILVDGNAMPDFSFPSGFNFEAKSLVCGDASVYEISAASIFAKVARDRLVQEVMHPEFPSYHWDSNVGYGTKQHIDAILRYGEVKYHRSSFVRSAVVKVRPEGWNLFND